MLDYHTANQDTLMLILLASIDQEDVAPELLDVRSVLAHIPGTIDSRGHGWHWVFQIGDGRYVYLWARTTTYGWAGPLDEVELTVFATSSIRNALRMVVTADDTWLPAPARTLLEDECQNA